VVGEPVDHGFGEAGAVRDFAFFFQVRRWSISSCARSRRESMHFAGRAVAATNLAIDDPRGTGRFRDDVTTAYALT
jgi:hypothetical protein